MPTTPSTDSHTHEVIAVGNVRIYRDINLYLADRAIYNTETKQIRGEKGRTSSEPYFLTGENIKEISENGYLIRNGTFTTEDSTTSDFHLQARTIRVYENDRVIFQNVTFYVGNVPIFWWPYLYQSLNDSFSFTISPAFLSSWGPSLLTQVTFPITDHVQARLRLDYRGRRGVAIGFDSEIHYGKDEKSVAKLKTYYLQDQNPLINRTGLPRGAVPTGRYRVGLEDRDHLHRRHLRHRRCDEAERPIRYAGFLPERISAQSGPGQRRGGDQIGPVLHHHRDRSFPGK